MKKKVKYLLLMLLLIFTCVYFFKQLTSFYASNPAASGIELNEGKTTEDKLNESKVMPESESTEETTEVHSTAGGEQAEPDKTMSREELVTTVMLHLFDQGYTEIPVWDEILVQQLSFLQSPIPGAKISTRDSQLPGAPRAYRNGTHEGLDYYDGYCGVSVRIDDPVFAAAAGVVLRVDHDYNELPVSEREEILRVSATAGDTPPYILDKLRGRQVWLAHSFNVVTRYAHLHTVGENIQVGDWLEAGEFIGTVGNSGTSNGARGTLEDTHLHFEIWVENYYLGEGLSPQQIRLLWQQILE